MEDKEKLSVRPEDDFYDTMPDEILQGLQVTREGFKKLFEKALAETNKTHSDPVEAMRAVFERVGIEFKTKPSPHPIPGHPDAVVVEISVRRPIGN